MTSNLVSTAWLAQHLAAPEFLILDASWHMPATKRDAKAEFEANHIPGARFFDLDASSDQNTSLPHMMPSAEKFAADMGAMGVKSDTHVVCYDTAGLFSAARCWWMLKSFGHAKVSVLDGGLPKWQREGREVETGALRAVENSSYTAHLLPDQVRSISDVKQAVKFGTTQIADARSPTRFRGEEVEPRPGVRPGHMPGAFNVHYATLLNGDGTMKTGTDLRDVFQTAGVDLNRPIITSCGSGVTAAILSLGLSELGIRDHSLYDGSWTEWGSSTEAAVTE